MLHQIIVVYFLNMKCAWVLLISHEVTLWKILMLMIDDTNIIPLLLLSLLIFFFIYIIIPLLLYIILYIIIFLYSLLYDFLYFYIPLYIFSLYSL